MIERVGKNTLKLLTKPSIIGNAGVVGKNEGEGPLAEEFDFIFDDDMLGEPSFEKAESSLQREALIRALIKSGRAIEDVEYIFAGDLLNQCIASTFSLREFGISFLGLFGACSTMALSLGLASVFTESGASKLCVAATSSHFCSAERQFRLPLEYGGQRTPTAQRTVTGAGACVLAEHTCDKPSVEAVTFGKIVDLGIKDANNMGAAMAPAAAMTVSEFFNDTGISPDELDAVVTGDLGFVGSELFLQLLKKDYSIDISAIHKDCGMMMFYREKQDVHCGGSGCGCSASVLNTYFMKRLTDGTYKKILFVATGALMSPTSSQQGESIPSIAHAVLITKPDCAKGEENV